MKDRDKHSSERKRKSGEIRLGPLNIPLRLLEALRGDRLIIFAGAGVSKPSPSDLPDFEKLTEQISEGSLERRSGEPPDVFLGRLAENGLQVHEKAARILSAPNSRHNDLHSLLVGLFSSTSKLRIVTTNFDHHFEGAIIDRWPTHDIEVCSAPALPTGNRFSGLVYVHGRIGKDPQKLVLIDSDFGRAYLTEGWARRFLREVFASYDVLFIGYSHEDVVLRYLARGLPPTHERVRFALTSDDPERWQFLGITPIQYDPADHHIAVREGLKAWLDLEGRGPLGHEREVHELVTRSPQALTEQEDDYLLFCVRDTTLAQFFFRHASDAAWLVWASDSSVLAEIFDPNGASSIAHQVAFWFMQEPLSERGDVARQLVYKAHRLSPQLWSEIARAVWLALSSDNQPPEAAERAAQWLSILDRLQNVHWLHLVFKAYTKVSTVRRTDP
ncbi:MAG: SIR2 family protein [Acidobacteriota bacterium]